MKRIPNLETEKAKTVCIEITIVKEKWSILFVYLPPNLSKTEFFEEILVTLNKTLNKYDNLLLAEDLNINTLRPTSHSPNYLSDLNDTFSLTNLVTDSTCFKSNKGTKPRSFYKPHSFVTGLNDCHKLVVSILGTSCQSFPPKFITYRFKKTSTSTISFVIWTQCIKIFEIFSEVLNYHAPSKQNQSEPIMLFL